MPKVARTWHSTEPGRVVYHNNTTCWDGNNIEQRYLASGTAGRRICSTCKGLNAKGQ